MANLLHCDVIVWLENFLSTAIGSERNLRGVVANVLDCNIVVSEFELQSRYYVHFHTNTITKSMNFLVPSDMG